MELSNKSLALVLVASILLSLGGTVFTLNQMSSGTTGLLVGRVNLTISSSVSCLVPNNVSFGTGVSPQTDQMLSTELDNAGFQDCTVAEPNGNCTGILINNTGNVDVAVNFSSDIAGAAFLGTPSTNAEYLYSPYNGTGTNHNSLPGCKVNGSTNFGSWATVPTTTTNICSNLTYNSTNKQIVIEFNATIHPGQATGSHTSTLTIRCDQI